MSSNPGLLKVLLDGQLSRRNQFNFRDYLSQSRVANLRLSTSNELLILSGAAMNVLALDRIDYRYVLSGGINGSVALYDLEGFSYCNSNNSSQLHPINTTNANTTGFSSVSSVQWYPEDCGLFIATNLGGELLIYDTNEFSIANQFQFSDEMIYASKMKSASDNAGPLVAVGLKSGLIHLCDLLSGDSSHILQGHSRAVTSVDWSPIHSYQLCSSSADGTIRVWDIRKGGTEAGLLWLDWRQDHTAVASVDIKRLASSHNSVPITRNGVEVVQDGTSSKPYRHLSTSSTGAGAALSVGKAHDQAVMSMRYTPDGNYILSGGNDQRLRLWSAHTGRLQPVHYDVPVSSGRHMPYQLEVMQVTSKASEDVIVLPDSSGANSSNGGDLLLVPLHSADGKATGRLKGHLGPVTAAAYRRPCQQLITSGKDGLILLWEPPCSSSSKGASYGTATAEDVDEDSWSVDNDDDKEGNEYTGRRGQASGVTVSNATSNSSSSSSSSSSSISNGRLRGVIFQDINQSSSSQIKRPPAVTSSTARSDVGMTLHCMKDSSGGSSSSGRDAVESNEGINWSVIDSILEENNTEDDLMAPSTGVSHIAGSSESVGGGSKTKTTDSRAGILRQLNKRRKA